MSITFKNISVIFEFKVNSVLIISVAINFRLKKWQNSAVIDG